VLLAALAGTLRSLEDAAKVIAIAIAIALMPPFAVVGYGIASGYLDAGQAVRFSSSIS